MFTWYGAALASFVVALPLMIKTCRAAMESVDRNLINASYTLGHSEWETALRVILPLAKRGIVAGTVLSFARAMGEFGATLMIAGNIPGKTNTLPLSIYTLAGSGNWSKAHILVLFLTLLSGLFLISGQPVQQENHLMGLSLNLRKQVNGFRLDVEWAMENELAVLFGFSGAGKSMTLQLIAGLLQPDEGWIYSGNRDSLRQPVGSQSRPSGPVRWVCFSKPGFISSHDGQGKHPLWGRGNKK